MVKHSLSYKEEIDELIQNSYISVPKSYYHSKDEAIVYLNTSVVEIRQYFSKICLILSTIFGFSLDDLNSWLGRFNSFVVANQNSVNSLEDTFLYEGRYKLTNDSIKFFNNYLQYVNNLVGELSVLCSAKFNNNKFVPEKGNIFIVHGHNGKLKDYLSKQLEKMGFHPIILSNEEDSGIALFDKFEKYANRCVKAIILMTKDDCVNKDDSIYYQARPNVFIELGYFLHMIKRTDIIVVCEKGVKIPSDIHGVCYIEYEDNLRSLFQRITKALNSNH